MHHDSRMTVGDKIEENVELKKRLESWEDTGLINASMLLSQPFARYNITTDL